MTSPTEGAVFNTAQDVDINVNITGLFIRRIIISVDSTVLLDDAVSMAASAWTDPSRSVVWRIGSGLNGPHIITVRVENFASQVTTETTNVTVGVSRGGNVYGWAWSSNTGYINLNCSQVAPGASPTPTPSSTGCSRSNYKVIVANTTGDVADITGYAWSNSIGWLSFNEADISDCPSATKAQLDFKTGEVTGWARFLTPKANPAVAGGWDGCMRLSGSNHTSPDLTTDNGGVTMNPKTGVFRGFAWAGDVVGWVNFNANTPGRNGYAIDDPATRFYAAPPVNCPGCVQGTPPPVVSCSAPYAPGYTMATLNSDGSVIQGSLTIPAAKITATGGAGTGYKYQWSINGITYSTLSTVPPSITVSGFPSNNSNPVAQNYNVYVVATNADGTSPSAPDVCGTVHQEGGAVPSSDLKIFIGKTSTEALTKSGRIHSAKKGGTFGLWWQIPEEVTGYECQTSVTRVSNGSAYAHWKLDPSDPSKPYWDDNKLKSDQTVDGLDTVGVENGDYRFDVSCEDNTNIDPRAPISGFVTLKLTSSSVIEI
ncbi:MAG: hypothetical protein WCV79_01300 [Candidatus Paceibacterota bacterium]